MIALRKVLSVPFFAVTCEVQEPNWIPFGSRHVLDGSVAARGPFASASEGERAIAESSGEQRRGWPWRTVQTVEADDRSKAAEDRFSRSDQYAAIADLIGRQQVDPRSDIWWQFID
jgi:hypothetical protein